ncbi:hypothetical protein VKT23_016352 [Stygiomarasmius scandens]|uniref:Uncharacterized protein n=1 Tax=Marasmiellus scandens TaxID=2682957 RepID=A0ABR1IVI3_9AGAR
MGEVVDGIDETQGGRAEERDEIGERDDENSRDGSGNEPQRPRFVKTLNQVAKRIWDKQNEEVKELVREAAKRDHEKELVEWKDSTGARPDSNNPEEFERALREFGPVAHKFCTAAAKQTGQLVSMCLVGPDGRNAGAPQINWIHVGSTPSNLIWPEYDPKGFEITEKSLTKFCLQVYNDEARAQRTIPSNVPIASSTGDIWSTPRDPVAIMTELINTRLPAAGPSDLQGSNRSNACLGPGRNSNNMVLAPPKDKSTRTSRRLPVKSMQTANNPTATSESDNNSRTRPRPRPRPRPLVSTPAPVLIPTGALNRRATSADPREPPEINFANNLQVQRPPASSTSCIRLPTRASSVGAISSGPPLSIPHHSAEVRIQPVVPESDGDITSQVPEPSQHTASDGSNSPHLSVLAEADDPWNHADSHKFWPLLKNAMEAFQIGDKWKGWRGLIWSFLELEAAYGWLEENGEIVSEKEIPSIGLWFKSGGKMDRKIPLRSSSHWYEAWRLWWDDVLLDADSRGDWAPLNDISGKQGLFKFVLTLFFWGKAVWQESGEGDQAKQDRASWMLCCTDLQHTMDSIREAGVIWRPNGRKRKADSNVPAKKAKKQKVSDGPTATSSTTQTRTRT